MHFIMSKPRGKVVACLCVYIYIYRLAKTMREEYKERLTWEENPFALSL